MRQPTARDAANDRAGRAPTPLFVRRTRSTGSAMRLAVPLVGVLCGALLLVLIAASVTGLARAASLAVLAPLLVLTTLLLWRSARASVAAAHVRSATVAAMRARGVVGVLAVAPSTTRNAEWQGWLERIMLATAPRLASTASGDSDSSRGQQALGLLHDLLGEARPAHGALLPLPQRTTLALLTDADEIHIWDVDALIEQAQDDPDTDLATAAEEGLLDLELHIMHTATAAAGQPRR